MQVRYVKRGDDLVLQQLTLVWQDVPTVEEEWVMSKCKCNWSGNPIPQDSFRPLDTAKTSVKSSQTNSQVVTKPKHAPH
ncbi:hypothetical protein [Candidatus Accumulibacter vicinus]|jgi:hypothetical protein|uniref:Uncharacterized protein n=1 Tax=Candidatus Accumulibacter vicinus TaxID=2954382 RepID=A0A084XUD2_9PROT|nr:hypothetical protein [Candidatus Accumulibacter vicinus]KFB66076.1 MAG: hypothetical protein CAPSK01_004679 [Candidatus Accumulibacter vicinus]